MNKDRKRLKGIWYLMKDRTINPKNIAFKHYGGRGIKVCSEWFNSFESFYEWSMSNGYKENLTIDRIDNDGDYEPSNCRWADRYTQANNRRNNIIVSVEGEKLTLAQYCRERNLNRKSIYQKEVIRRQKGITTRSEYLKKEQDKTLAKVELLRQTMQQFPGYSNCKLAAVMNISEAYVRKLKKMM